jgi:magnesium transporter
LDDNFLSDERIYQSANHNKAQGGVMRKEYKLQEGKITETSDEHGQILVYVNPDPDELKYLQDECKIDAHNLSSALDPDELARIEFEPDHIATILKRPKNYSSDDRFLFKVSSLGMFLFKDRIVIVMGDEVSLFEGKHFSRVDSVKDVLIKVIYNIILHFLGHLKVINMISESLEQKINSSMKNRYLLNMFTLEKSLVYYLNASNSNAVVIDKLKTNALRIGFTPESIEFLDDLIIENNQCAKLADIYSSVIASLMDARASIISNNLNVMMKNLNAIVIAVAIPSFFAGVGGMSEFSGMIGFQHWKIGYPLFVLGMVLMAAGIFFLIKMMERLWRR